MPFSSRPPHEARAPRTQGSGRWTSVRWIPPTPTPVQRTQPGSARDCWEPAKPATEAPGNLPEPPAPNPIARPHPPKNAPRAIPGQINPNLYEPPNGLVTIQRRHLGRQDRIVYQIGPHHDAVLPEPLAQPPDRTPQAWASLHGIPLTTNHAGGLGPGRDDPASVPLPPDTRYGFGIVIGQSQGPQLGLPFVNDEHPRPGATCPCGMDTLLGEEFASIRRSRPARTTESALGGRPKHATVSGGRDMESRRYGPLAPWNSASEPSCTVNRA